MQPGIPLFRPLLRMRISTPSSSLRSFHASCLKQARAQASKSISKKAPLLKPSPPSLRNQPQSNPFQGLNSETAQKLSYANALYAAGTRTLYQAPSHAGMLAASYFLGIAGVGMGVSMAYIDIAWRGDLNPTLPTVIKSAWLIGIAFCTAAGGFFFIRPLHMIRSIDLISKDGSAKLLVQVRRTFFFQKPHQYVLSPDAIHSEVKFVRQIPVPEYIASTEAPKNPIAAVARSISKGIFYIFASVRKLASKDGIMYVSFTANGKKRACQLDTDGWFSNGAKDLVRLFNRTPDF